MNWYGLLVLFHFCLSVSIALRIIYSRRSSSAALAWLTVLFAFPLLGVIVYLLIGESKLGRARAQRQAELLAFHDAFADRFLPPQTVPLCEVRFRQIAHLVQADSGYVATGGNATRLLTDTDAILRAFVADIEAARAAGAVPVLVKTGNGRAVAHKWRGKLDDVAVYANVESAVDCWLKEAA